MSHSTMQRKAQCVHQKIKPLINENRVRSSLESKPFSRRIGVANRRIPLTMPAHIQHTKTVDSTLVLDIKTTQVI